ncbi:MAG: DnaB-like helicase C-terminal domain-containing protein [candidate division Zixibacteria bacterium]
MQESTEALILRNLIYNEEYSRRVLPYLQAAYFSDRVDRTLFETIAAYIIQYNNRPSKEAIVIALNDMDMLNEDEFKAATAVMNECEKRKDETNTEEWLFENAEEFCKSKALHNAIMDSIHIIDGTKKKLTKNAIPELLTEALSISFDPHIGHDFIENADERYDFYHTVEAKVPFDLEFFNKVTNGGLSNKTLNICMAGTGVGKSLFMCHYAASALADGKNVLYITCEMAEERIGERIDANLMGLSIDDVRELPKTLYDKKIERIQKKCKGKLIIKEYPTATANVNHFRHLLSELRLKKNFKPDIIFIDYLNICASARFSANANVGMYTYIKAIAEELRGLAVEYNVPIMSATQTNRSGFSSSDVGLEDTSESFGLPATADFMFAMIRTDDLDALGQVLFKQLKNRYNDVASNRKFVVGIDRPKMKLFDVAQVAQATLTDTGQPLDQSGAGSGYRSTDFDSKFKNKPKLNV